MNLKRNGFKNNCRNWKKRTLKDASPPTPLPQGEGRKGAECSRNMDIALKELVYSVNSRQQPKKRFGEFFEAANSDAINSAGSFLSARSLQIFAALKRNWL